MGKLTSKEISTAVGLVHANSPAMKAYVNSLMLKAPAAESLLLSAVVEEARSKQLLKTDENGAMRCMARVNAYNSQVATMLAKALRENDRAEMKEIIGAINKFDAMTRIAPGEIKYGIRYMVAEIFGNKEWMAKAAKKLKEIVDMNIGLGIAAENYAREMARGRLN